eukprot:6710256-Pyramimonas_sp.AAC.1
MAFGAPFLTPTGLVTTQAFPRCGDGQAAVQRDPSSWLPVRARFGPLPYLARTVGRAERHAIREGLDAFPDHQGFVTDLLALARECERRHPELEQ